VRIVHDQCRWRLAATGTIRQEAELGHVVAAKVIAWADQDGSQAVWTGTVPTGPGLWNGTNPVEPLMGTWKTWVLSSASQLRPGPPPAYDSPQRQAELNEVKDFPRGPAAFNTNERAMYYQALDHGVIPLGNTQAIIPSGATPRNGNLA